MPLPRVALVLLLLAGAPSCGDDASTLPSLDPALSRLAAAWQAGPAALGELCSPADRDRLVNAVGRAWAQRAWLRGRPPLAPEGSAEVRGPDQRAARQALGAGTLQSEWRLVAGAWVLEDLTLDLLGLEERVLDAWASGDPGSLAPFLSDAGAVAELRAALAERGLSRLPEVASHALEEQGGAQVLVCSGPQGSFELGLRRAGPIWFVDWQLPGP